VPARRSGSGSRILYVAAGEPYLREVNPHHPSGVTPGVFVPETA
jgi:hypothetical protein